MDVVVDAVGEAFTGLRSNLQPLRISIRRDVTRQAFPHSRHAWQRQVAAAFLEPLFAFSVQDVHACTPFATALALVLKTRAEKRARQDSPR